MAEVEQLIYGVGSDPAQTARSVLARSPGMSRDCAAEIVRLCEGWGTPPPGEIIRPGLLSFPLVSLLPALPGRPFVLIRVTNESALMFHAVVTTEYDYAKFGLNPFAVAHENIFLDRWAPGIILDRRDLRPTSLAPLVTPLPSESDVALIGEALRQLLSLGQLRLPLNRADEESDRYLALILSALPLSTKKSLRFASFANSEVNDYLLAALHSAGSQVTGWHRLLMASLSGPVTAQMNAYLESVSECLTAGDLLGLERLSTQAQIAVSNSQKRSSPLNAGALAATIHRGAEPVPPQAPRERSMSAARTAHVTNSPPLSESAGQLAPRTLTATRRVAMRRVSARRKQHRKAPQRLLSLLLLGLLISGAVYLLDRSGWDKLPWRSEVEDSEHRGPSLLGVIDVGALYNKELGAFSMAGMNLTKEPLKQKRDKALTALRVGAASELSKQASLFVDLASQGIHHSSRPSRESERLVSLEKRGAVLEREMQRLMLGYFSFASGVLWRDLGDMSDEQLKARWDSLRRKEPQRVVRLAEDLAMAGQLPEVGTARRQVAGMAQLVSLFAHTRKNNAWASATAKSARSLSDNTLRGAAAAYRACGRHMASLKRAEEAAEFQRLAFAPRYEEYVWFPAVVEEVLPRLRATIKRYGADAVPPLTVATLAFYDDLPKVGRLAREGAEEKLSAMIQKLASNRAVAFDAEHYADHVDRIRFVSLQYLTRQGRDLYDLPDHHFPGGDKVSAIRFLNNLDQDLNAQEWREIAKVSNQPFYTRWANEHARSFEVALRRLNRDFDAAYGEVATLSGKLQNSVRHGQDWTDMIANLSRRAAALSTRFRGLFPEDIGRSERLASVDSLAAALSRSLILPLAGVTLRMDQPVLSEPLDVVLELSVAGRPLHRSPAFRVGPAAPAASGWVGSQLFDLAVPLQLGQSLQVRVYPSLGGDPIFAAVYGEAENAPLPGALTRSREGVRPLATGGTGPVCGSIVFKTAAEFWTRLEVPAIIPR